MIGGTAARIVLNAVPFVLPLMFQLGMGYDGVRAGLTLTPLFVGNIGIKPLTSAILRIGGFRRVLGRQWRVADRDPARLRAHRSGDADLRHRGLARHLRRLALDAIHCARDTPLRRRFRGGDEHGESDFSVVFQAAMAFGVGFGAMAIKIGTIVAPAPTLASFHVAFIALAALMLCAVVDHSRLEPNAAISVSGARKKT